MMVVSFITLHGVKQRVAIDDRRKTFDLSQPPTYEEEYTLGYLPPRYPVPAKRMRTFEYWKYLGYVSAENNFDVEIVQRLNRYR